MASCKKSNSSFELTIDDFKKDQLLAELQINFNSIKSGGNTTANQYVLINEGIEISRKIVKKYTQEKALEFVQILKEESGSHEADVTFFWGCDRKQNGTVDYSDCNFFEFIGVAIVSAFSCNSPGAGASQADIEAYYDCVQEVVCKTC